MSRKEIDRLEVIQATANRRLYQNDAARQLGLSMRQIKRLVAGYRREGARHWSRDAVASVLRTPLPRRFGR